MREHEDVFACLKGNFFNEHFSKIDALKHVGLSASRTLKLIESALADSR